VPTDVGGVHYDVTAEYVNNAGVQCINTAEEVQTQLTQLKSYVQSLESVYVGPASSQWQALMQQWDMYAQRLHQGLTGVGQGLGVTGNNYTQVEDQAQKNVTSLHLPAINLS
jgi:WXG100 family type VII secretion target